MSIKQRHAAAQKYLPAKVKLLLVAEAPPCDLDRYFYFEKVDTHDWLFRYVWEGLTGEKPNRNDKPAHLAALKAAGVFLIDLHEDNISQPTLKQLAPKVPDLVQRCRALKPKHIILIKHVVYDAAFEALTKAGLPVIDEQLPFPASGQQKKFLDTFRRAAAPTGVTVR